MKMPMDPFYRPIVVAALVSISLGMVSALSPNSALNAWGRLQGQIAEYERLNQELEKENQALAMEISALSGNPKVLERAAREALGMVRPEEIIFNFEE